MEINELIELAHDCAKEKGWWDKESTFAEQIALMHSELSEALEEYRDGRSITEVYYSGGQSTELKPEGIPIELADLAIRLFDTCGRHNIDLESSIRIKMQYNCTRPHRHGGKVI